MAKHKVKISTSVQQKFVCQSMFGTDLKHSPFQAFEHCSHDGPCCEERTPPRLSLDDFSKLPFAFTVEHPKKAEICSILKLNLSEQFKWQDCYYQPGFVCYVLKKCLEAIGVNCSVVTGLRKEREDRDHIPPPHVWLNIDGTLVDTAFSKCLAQKKPMFEREYPSCYRPDAFLYCERRHLVILTEDEMSWYRYKKTVDLFLTEPSKALALNLNFDHLRDYYFNMTRFIWVTFKIHLSAFDPLVRHRCWSCGMLPAKSGRVLTKLARDMKEHDSDSKTDKANLTFLEFKYCKQCMVAKYCSIACQKKDWDILHRFVCVSRTPGLTNDQPY